VSQIEHDEGDSPAERDQTELEALVDLVGSDGWLRYVAHVEGEWGADAYARKIDSTIATAKASGASVEQELCELGAACRHVRLSVKWPEGRIAQLKAGKPKSLNPFANRRRA
jgi:hypothetical protein